MALQQRQPFSDRGDFVALKDSFRFAGRQFHRGDDFPWRELACSTRRLRQLYEGRFISLKEEEETPVPEDEELKESSEGTDEESTDERTDDEPEADEESAEEEESDEESDEEADEDTLTIFDPEVHEIVVEGSKRYICADGEKLVQVTKREAKRLNLLRKPAEINMGQVIEEEE